MFKSGDSLVLCLVPIYLSIYLTIYPCETTHMCTYFYVVCIFAEVCRNSVLGVILNRVICIEILE